MIRLIPSTVSKVTIRGLATTAASPPPAASKSKRVVFIDGVRTPFLQAGTDFNDLMPVDLQRHAILYVFNLIKDIDYQLHFQFRSLIRKTKVPEKEIGYVVCGTGMLDGMRLSLDSTRFICSHSRYKHFEYCPRGCFVGRTFRQDSLSHRDSSMYICESGIDNSLWIHFCWFNGSRSCWRSRVLVGRSSQVQSQSKEVDDICQSVQENLAVFGSLNEIEPISFGSRSKLSQTK